MTSQPSLGALITGATSGIGKATAIAFANAGIHVALVSRSPDKLEAVAEVARQHGDKETVKADFDRGAMLTPEMVARSILRSSYLRVQ
jgi:short-subunit dehydrogenase